MRDRATRRAPRRSRRGRRSLQPLDARDQRAVEPLDSNALEFVDTAVGRGDQAVDVDVHAASAEGLEVGDPALPQRPRAGGVAAAQVLEAHPDLQDALVEVAHRIALGQPLLLERFVLLVELAMVELLDPPPQARRRRLRAAAAALPAAGSQTLHRCPKLAPIVHEYRLLLRFRGRPRWTGYAHNGFRDLRAA